MKPADPVTPSNLTPLFNALHILPEVEEKQSGLFHHRGIALLHFHEDAAGRFADLRRTDFHWQCYPVNTPGEQARLLLQLWLALPDAPAAERHPRRHEPMTRHAKKRGLRTQPRAPLTRGHEGASCRSHRGKP